MLKQLKIICLVLLFSFAGSQRLPAEEINFEKNPDGSFKIPKSMLDAADRRMASETDPYKKLQLLLRWIKIKEEFDKNQVFDSSEIKVKQLDTSKKEIIARIEKELPALYQTGSVNVEQLFRELGFRYLELRNFEKTISNLNRIQNKSAEDELAIGDALLAMDKVPEAISAYEQAGDEFRLKNLAAYKRAWAHMRQNEFAKALVEFDLALSPNENADAHLYEEAFQDRIRPYLETFHSDHFVKEDADSFKKLAYSISSKDNKRARELFVQSLKSIVEGFTAKSEIELAQEAFYFITREIEDATEILILSAPTWIKVYRARLEHNEVARIIDSLPNKTLDPTKSNPLRTELYNTAVFYETFKENETGPKISHDLLRKTYAKYFQLYPDDQDADGLRVNYGKLLLEDENAKHCLEILSKRSKSDPATEDVAFSLEGKCDLKYLDQMYSQKHNDEFYKFLSKALLQEKVYTRKNIGIEETKAFQGLTRMLMGAIGKNTKSELLRASLKDLIENYPYPKEDQLFTELQITRAELEFKDLLDSNQKPSEKAPLFFGIYQNSPPTSEVAQKAITNSIVMSNGEDGLTRCDEFKLKYRSNFKPNTQVFDRCIQLAEHFLNLETEYRYWDPEENKLSRDQQLRVGLLELALGINKGRERIESINDEKATSILENWDGVSEKKITTDPRFQKIQKETRSFLSSLKPIKFVKISDRVPVLTKDFGKIDKAIVDYYESNPEPLFMARALDMRAELAAKMHQWLANLPSPPSLTEEEKQEYLKGTQDFLNPWKQGAEARAKECAETAYSLSPDFKQTEDGFCKGDVSDKVFFDFVNSWKKSIPHKMKMQRIVQIILARAKAEQQALKARYLLFRALDLSKNDFEKARVYLALAQLTDKARFWKNAAALDGSLEEPILWLKKGAEGNPFFEKLYSFEVRSLRSWARN